MSRRFIGLKPQSRPAHHTPIAASAERDSLVISPVRLSVRQTMQRERRNSRTGWFSLKICGRFSSACRNQRHHGRDTVPGSAVLVEPSSDIPPSKTCRRVVVGCTTAMHHTNSEDRMLPWSWLWVFSPWRWSSFVLLSLLPNAGYSSACCCPSVA